MFDPKLGYGGDPVPDLPILHGTGQKNIGESIGKSSASMSADDLFDQLDPIVGKQLKDLDTVLTNPTNVAQRQIVTDVAPEAFSPEATPAQQAAGRTQMVETGTDVKFAQGFNPELGRSGNLVMKNGVLRLAQGALLSGPLTLLSAAGDAQAVSKLGKDEGSDMGNVAKDIEGLGGAAGLASLINPAFVPASVALNVIGSAIRLRMERDKDEAADEKQMDPKTRTNFAASVDATITDTNQLEKERGYGIETTL